MRVTELSMSFDPVACPVCDVRVESISGGHHQWPLVTLHPCGHDVAVDEGGELVPPRGT